MGKNIIASKSSTTEERKGAHGSAPKQVNGMVKDKKETTEFSTALVNGN